jgi:hypothetical protein
VAAATVAGCGGVAAAPAASTLPVAPGVRVIASAPGGSQVDPTHDHNRYRYVALSGPADMTGSGLIVAEVHSLRNRGWGQERSVAFRPGTAAPQPVPVTTVGAEVLLNAPDRRVYAAMSLLPNRAVAGAQTARTPLFANSAIGQALVHHRPVLWIVLGNGAHS